jgi:UPF0042 nucleotide-binding protein
MESNRFLIITGMSGAGKTNVIRTLEDLNYFCVDNLPADLIPKFAELSRQAPDRDTALVVDSRSGNFVTKLKDVLDEMGAMGIGYDLLFLDASDEVLIRRYKETRRPHPMQHGNNLAASVAAERKYLSLIKERATQVIDTSNLAPKELKEKIRHLYAENSLANRMLIIVQSFGFKHGLPLDSDMVFDVRFLPNPFYEPELKHLTGNDQPVGDFLTRFPDTYTFLKKQFDLVDFLLPKYVEEGKSQLVIGIGCTGGQHRSVYLANKLYEYLRMKGYYVQLVHRDIDKSK